MDASLITAIGGLLAAVSVGALLKIVSRFLKHIEKKDADFTTFLGNHLSKNTRAMERVAERLESVEDSVRGR